MSSPGDTPDVTPGMAARSSPGPGGGQGDPGASLPPADEDVSTTAASLEAQLAEVRARARGDATVRVRVEAPHSEFIHGGVWVGPDYTDVPEQAVAAMMEAASNSGVTLTQEEV